MHRSVVLALLFALSACVSPSNSPSIPPGMEGGPEITSIRTVVDDVYAIVSGDKGETRPWDRLESHFIAGAQLTASRTTAAGTHEVRSFTPGDFVANARQSSERRAFHESPLVTRILQFQGVAVAISSYEARVGEAVEPTFRGVNVFQLVRTPEGWKIASIAWSDEDAQIQLPDGWSRRGR
ncbi:MAG: hypothetical protein O2865_12635 [Planctomycetota bacterium]|nr:hypothetical protein [Planctomycetota bacterium]MDA0931912.1 hypothetical protein [Planctomycetota bacterium]MDA1222139.1 hypothetical protein [Planctomycetota bacterium]